VRVDAEARCCSSRARHELFLDFDGVFCGPGSSAEAGPDISYGHPASIRAALTVAGGTGSSEDASGSGSKTLDIAGDVGVERIVGTLN
jgi:hypothetical protein